MHRSRPLLLRDPERFAHQGGDRRGTDDLPGHLGHRRHGRDDVDDLKARLLAAQDALLAGDHDHRHGTQERVGGAGRQVERAGAQRRQADAGPSG